MQATVIVTASIAMRVRTTLSMLSTGFEDYAREVRFAFGKKSSAEINKAQASKLKTKLKI
jgi:hypothetical protein